ncbi:MAG TPA: hypothetical protein ENN09_06040, partial [Planctomycetes bacterium]|nr:hypothetical protein [Planctomycetota bacterium]
MKALLIVTPVALLCLRAAAEAMPPPDEIVLRVDATVDGPYVRICDVAEVSGPSAAVTGRLVITRPAEFPAFISADAVMARVQREGRTAKVSGAQYCRVTSIAGAASSAPTDPAGALIEQLERAIRADMGPEHEGAVLSLSVLNV